MYLYVQFRTGVKKVFMPCKYLIDDNDKLNKIDDKLKS